MKKFLLTEINWFKLRKKLTCLLGDQSLMLFVKFISRIQYEK